jgi:MFS family permease
LGYLSKSPGKKFRGFLLSKRTMDNDSKRHFRLNYIANLLDGGIFGFAFGFASLTTVIPLFVSNLTDSAILIGLIPAIHAMGWQLPQLFNARYVSQLKRLKPYVLLMTIQERVPFLGLMIIAWQLPALGIRWGLILTFVMLIWQGLGAGFTANPWQNMIGKIFPSEYRGTFFGLQAAASNLLASIGAILAGFILQKMPFPENYALCFLYACGCLVISFFCLSTTREPERTTEILPSSSLLFWNSVLAILKRDKPFRAFLITRLLSQFGSMAFAFYTVYAVRRHGMSEVTAGVMTSALMITQVAANPLLGWLADRWSRKGILELGAVCAMLSAILAWLAPNIAVFFIVVILAGIANTVFWTIGMTLTLDFGTDAERPTYVGLSNTLIAPATILAPLIGGWLADRAGYSATFLFAAFASLVTVIVLHLAVHDKRNPEF